MQIIINYMTQVFEGCNRSQIAAVQCELWKISTNTFPFIIRIKNHCNRFLSINTQANSISFSIESRVGFLPL